jgi:hypothetical protein
VSDDPWTDPTAEVWARGILRNMAPKMADSAVAVSLYPQDGTTGDVKYWVELGAMICMDKPILVVAMGDAVLPRKLELVADKIVRLPDGLSESGSQQLADAVVAFVQEHP